MRVMLFAASLIVLAHPALAAERPAIGGFGFDTTAMDRSVKPGDDFNRFANGSWLARTEFPADKAYIGVAIDVDEKARAQVRSIIEAAAADQSAAPGSVTRKVGDYYAAFMDEAAIEARGLAPVQPLLASIAAVTTRTELIAAMGRANRLGIGLPIGLGIGIDDKNPDAFTVTLAQSGLGLPDRDYYLDTAKPEFAKARAAYLAYMAAMLRHAGMDNAAARAEAIMALETRLATVHWTQVESRQAEKLYNPVATAELAGKFPGMDWQAFLAPIGVASERRVIVAQPSAIAGTARLIGEAPIAVWKDYLALRTMGWASGTLPKAVLDTQFELTRALTGAQQLRPRWQRGGAATSAALGDAVGQIYVQKHFPPDSKAKIDAMVKNIIAAMDRRLANLDWMDPATRAVAREKLAAFRPKIGFPDKWRNYDALVVDKADALGNRMRAAELDHAREIAKLGKPADRDEWYLAPMVVNAYANPTWNEIVFPAAILQAPFFDDGADDAVNYGAIGAVIGHEITHHFDDQGRKYDKTGRLADWWTPQDVKRFEARAAVVVQQYAAYEPIPGSKLNGELTLGENIADIAGLLVAWDAWQLARQGNPAANAVIDGFTPEQRFFLGYGQAWRAKMRPQLLQQVIVSDPHAPAAERAQAVRNLDGWYQAFDVKPGDRLYLPPEQRARPW
ncbi:M13 family metallopeptidase [Sandarakinorhabdus sp. AAP62]|uniref:M13 family metallopeptidase n=1 Tax=Sandarakinorhabdus sp. AAP62 TaxID=1248916 RepID=UPI0002D25B7C|nr:M13 family metallopeptidase [Sandarakinorhabdus sp. AAP62]